MSYHIISYHSVCTVVLYIGWCILVPRIKHRQLGWTSIHSGTTKNMQRSPALYIIVLLYYMKSQLLAQMECFICGCQHNRRRLKRRKGKCPWLRIAPSLVELLDLLARLEAADAMAAAAAEP